MTFKMFWHITTKCMNKCRHCYRYNTKDEEKNLSTAKLLEILDRLDEFELKYKTKIDTFIITGGDPLLHPGWEKLLIELKKRNKKVLICGISQSLTEKNLEKLSKLNIFTFQLSLDGFEKNNDYMRGKGRFEDTLKKVKLLKKYKINSTIKFTLFPFNKNDLIPLYGLV